MSPSPFEPERPRDTPLQSPTTAKFTAPLITRHSQSIQRARIDTASPAAQSARSMLRTLTWFHNLSHKHNLDLCNPHNITIRTHTQLDSLGLCSNQGTETKTTSNSLRTHLSSSVANAHLPPILTTTANSIRSSPIVHCMAARSDICTRRAVACTKWRWRTADFEMGDAECLQGRGQLQIRSLPLSLSMPSLSSNPSGSGQGMSLAIDTRNALVRRSSLVRSQPLPTRICITADMDTLTRSLHKS
ncbi:uncharacterized protein FOMMEDRAFT_163846 [Fomitiporia mediterranea MF3/22]|uniref:Uncharacterized protein n=1 Tax=Fomitiporia mediterranea (strain MF3/22) TaxID=694068 RepID=R7SF40_FOMME|nr:uncharacterized protein FOMMEDRAFT_163846 [Fomitiporia mediterranea MF3/22]EJC97341.1 hypothetical protein FOMMEDRAFT_163846 [Fomitiporia mediterranea MF3/22]